MARYNLASKSKSANNDRTTILLCVLTINQIMGIKHYEDIDKLIEIKRLFEQESRQLHPSLERVKGKS